MIFQISCGKPASGCIQHMEVRQMMTLECETAMVQDAVSPQPGGNESDAALLCRYFKHGDRDAMTQFYLRHADRAYRIAFACTGNAADAEDVLQNAFVQLLAKGAELCAGPDANIRGWLMSVVINASKMNARAENSRRKREESAAPPEQVGAAPSAERAELISAAMQSVHALPVLYRLPVSLHYIEGLSIDEVSSTLSIPQKTLRSQISRGLEQIREALAVRGFSVAALPIHELIAAAPLATAPTAAAISFDALVNSALSKTAAAATTAGALLPKFAAAIVALVLAAAVVVFRSGPPADDSAPKDDKNAPPVAAAENPAEINPMLTEILARKIDVNYQRHYLKEVLDELQESCGLKSVYPECLRNLIYTWDRKNVTVKEVLDHLATEGLQYEYHGTTLVIWRPVNDAIVVRLENTMSDGNDRARSEAVCEMSGLADKRVCKMLVNALNDKDPSTRMWATFSLVAFRSMLPYADAPKDLSARLLKDLPAGNEFRAATVRVACSTGAPQAEKILIEWLRAGDPSTRYAASETLRHYHSAEATAALNDHIGDADQDVRNNVGDALLGRINDTGITHLTELMERTALFQHEANALAGIPPDRLNQHLTRALEGNIRQARWNVPMILAYVRGEKRAKAFEQLLGFLNDPTPPMRRLTAFALAYSANPDAVPHLIKFYENSTEATMKRLAVESIARLRSAEGNRWIFDKVSRIEKQDMVHFIRALGDTRDERGEKIILALRGDVDTQVSSFAAQAVTSMRSPRVIEANIDALKSTDTHTRWNAAIGLSRTLHPSAIPVIVRFLTDAPDNWMPGVAATCLRRYLGMGNLASREVIKAALEEYETGLRKAKEPLPASGDF